MPRLAPEFEFTKVLVAIGKKLVRLSSKELKSNLFSKYIFFNILIQKYFGLYILNNKLNKINMNNS